MEGVGVRGTGGYIDLEVIGEFVRSDRERYISLLGKTVERVRGCKHVTPRTQEGSNRTDHIK